MWQSTVNEKKEEDDDETNIKWEAREIAIAEFWNLPVIVAILNELAQYRR
jgi:hypothetical protein